MRSLLAVAVLSACALTAVAAGDSVVSGSVSFVTKRGQKPNPAETLIWLEPTGATAPLPPRKAQMITRAKALTPHVLAVPAGSTVEFPNQDPITHNLFSVSSANPFDLGLYRRGAGKSRTFDKPGIVNVYCNVHPNMSAVIHVMKSPYYTFADAGGGFRIENVPAGRYRLLAWNELGSTPAVEIQVASDGKVSGQTKLAIDSRSFRMTQHRNKLGKPYTVSRTKDY